MAPHDNKRPSQSAEIPCNNLDEVRRNIDYLDRELVTIIALRGKYVAQAATFKTSTEDVKAPQRVEAVIHKVRTLAQEAHTSPDLVEAVWRAMIAHFTATEIAEFKKLQ